MFHATTIVGIRHNGKVAIAGDGQVTMGENIIMKNKATKIRKIYNDKILVGFAGSVADAFTLCEKFEQKVEKYNGNLRRSAIELAKEWRSDKALRKLEALLIVMDQTETLILSGNGEVIEPDDDVAAIGSGGSYALSAARALKKYSTLSAKEMVFESLKIASEICVFTNSNISVEVLEMEEN
ncbi:ATP-dependent protease subunit HslV [Acetobacterium tundrae]|uniref:ATP-dependent protease subunit HslV n=1 Tax=Acetobacterium tundrae TaxID=132932 RepID=A0ABR6WJQ8_9FIRM|nr:ATP-dependent protease subunit HslV [Acetobacterium tundrae]MBC3796513.1 ATP-dependent protease subunit HslV [Acetobacterium tundrae]